MTDKQVSLWYAIEALAQRVPFTKHKVESALGATLVEDQASSNRHFLFYRSSPIELKGGVVIKNVDLRVKRAGGHPGFVVLEIEGEGVTLEQVRRRYENVALSGVPGGQSLDEATSYTAKLPWGQLTFGFAERNPGCLAWVAFEPKEQA